MPKKVLVTGARGYLGSTFIPYLARNNYEPVALLRENDQWDPQEDIEVRRGNLLDKGFLSEALDDADIILHFAGLKSYDLCAREIAKAIESNVTFTDRILHAVNKDKRIVFCSTYWVYGHKSALPYREDTALMPSEPYGWTKALAERLVATSSMNYTILRLANVFGFGSGRGYDEVVSFFLRRAIAGETISLKNGGTHRIDLISIDDVCRAFIDVLKIDKRDLVLNIGSGSPLSISELAGIVNGITERHTGNKAPILKEPEEAVSADRWVDISRLTGLTGFTPTPVVTGIEKFFCDMRALTGAANEKGN